MGNKNTEQTNIGARIGKYRTAAGLSQEEVAEATGTSQKHLSRIEQGYHDPSFILMIKIAQVLNVPLDMLSYNAPDDDIMLFIQNDLKGMSKMQLEALRKEIELIKEYVK